MKKFQTPSIKHHKAMRPFPFGAWLLTLGVFPTAARGAMAGRLRAWMLVPQRE